MDNIQWKHKQWKHKVIISNLFDVPEDGGLEFERFRDRVVKALIHSKLFCTISDIIQEMARTSSPNDFDLYLSNVYDFADENQIFLSPVLY